jgi:Fic family protein
MRSPLMLWQQDLIRAPMFSISAYFEAHRDACYERLLAVSRDGDWTGWCVGGTSAFDGAMG